MEKNKYDVILFDCHNIYHRAYRGDEKVMTNYNNTKIQIQGISGSLTRIIQYQKSFLKEGGTCYYLFDNPTTGVKRAQAILPTDYKGNRKKESKAFYVGLNYLETILLSFRDGDKVLRESNTEADDWVKYILETLEGKRVLLISTDLDWCRSLSEDIHWLSWYNKKIYTPKEFKEHYGFEATESSVCFYKCFYGDSSDNIVGRYIQMSPKKFQYVIDNFKDMKEFLNGCRRKKIPLFNDAIYGRMERERANLNNNWDLVTYRIIPNSDLEKYMITTKLNLLKLNQIYKGLCINVDKRTISSNDIMDSMLEKQLTQRK